MKFVSGARGCALFVLAMGASPLALGQDAKDNPGFVERVTVTGSRLSVQNQPGSTTLVTSGDLQRRDIFRLGEALTLTPGVSLQPGNRGGARNEASIYIRGFDLSRVPVLLDGVPIYVPYDGYIDLNRIQTFDLSAIEVARGYSSVMYGPNAMAGAVNLVRRRPSDGFAATGAIRIDATSDLDHSGTRATALASYGANEWYIQGGVGWLDQDFTTLPGDFTAGLFQPTGERRRSFSNDLAANIRAGWTPGADEYVLTYIVQNGEKGAPPYAENVPNRATFFDWPYYDKESAYANTRTVFGNGWSLKGRLFYDGFQNQLRRYDNGNYTTQALPFAFTSNYDDYTFGGSAELNIPTSQAGALRIAAFVKRDVHREFRPGGPVSKMKDVTTSIAVDYREELAPGLTATAGASFDTRAAGRADNPSVIGTQFAVKDQSAFNIQAGLEYALSDNFEMFGGVSRKSRFATMFERYSYRLGFGQPNPALEPETLTTIEGGVRGSFASWLTGSASVFWGDADRYVQNVTIGFNPAPPFNAITQSQNIGNVRISGFEADISANWEWLNARLTYGYLDRSLKTGATPLFGTPENKLDADIEAQLGDGFFAQGNIAYRDGFNTSDAGTGNPISAYTTAGLKGGWRNDSGLSLEIAVQNLFDTLYEFDDGYPGAGRSVSLTLRHTL